MSNTQLSQRAQDFLKHHGCRVTKDEDPSTTFQLLGVPLFPAVKFAHCNYANLHYSVPSCHSVSLGFTCLQTIKKKTIQQNRNSNKVRLPKQQQINSGLITYSGYLRDQDGRETHSASAYSSVYSGESIVSESSVSDHPWMVKENIGSNPFIAQFGLSGMGEHNPRSFLRSHFDSDSSSDDRERELLSRFNSDWNSVDSDTSDSEPEISQPYPDNIQPDPDDYGGPLINSNSKDSYASAVTIENISEALNLAKLDKRRHKAAQKTAEVPCEPQPKHPSTDSRKFASIFTPSQQPVLNDRSSRSKDYLKKDDELYCESGDAELFGIPQELRQFKAEGIRRGPGGIMFKFGTFTPLFDSSAVIVLEIDRKGCIHADGVEVAVSCGMIIERDAFLNSLVPKSSSPKALWNWAVFETSLAQIRVLSKQLKLENIPECSDAFTHWSGKDGVYLFEIRGQNEWNAWVLASDKNVFDDIINTAKKTLGENSQRLSALWPLPVKSTTKKSNLIFYILVAWLMFIIIELLIWPSD